MPECNFPRKHRVAIEQVSAVTAFKDFIESNKVIQVGVNEAFIQDKCIEDMPWIIVNF